MKMLRYQGRKNTDEASRMKCKRCKTQDVAYQDEKRRMQQIGAVQDTALGVQYIVNYEMITSFQLFTLPAPSESRLPLRKGNKENYQ